MFNILGHVPHFFTSISALWAHFSAWRYDQKMRNHELNYAFDLKKIGDPESAQIAERIISGARLVDVLPASKY